jgi:general secretion pathway protein D
VSTRAGSGDSQASPDAHYSLNKEAGLLTLFARPPVHRAVQNYLKLLNSSSQRQVLIEATVVEVALSDSFEAGVDWQVLASGINGLSAAQILAGAPQLGAQSINSLGAPAGLVSLVQQSGSHDVQATLSLLEQFGDVRILSRPRIIALNNQSSVLKVVDNRVYFTVNVQRRQNENEDEIETETEIHTVPVGLVMNVTPQISAQGSVMLNVRPTLSRILGFVNDPNPQLAQANVRNGVPEIQVREMETMLQVQSGHVAVIGGLMQETRSDNNAQLPGLGRLAGIGRLFRKQSTERRQTELLIVIKPTVISANASDLAHE